VSADVTLAEAGGVSQPEPSILVVNDSEGQRIAMRAMLRPLGVVVVEADSGAAALHAVLRQTFALILMDVRMPIIDGFETARLIRQRRQSSRTPIIFVTAFGREDTETLTAYTSGAVDFIFAPVVSEVVRAKVSVFVELFVQAQQLQRSLDSITMLNTALRDSEASTQAVLDNVADGIVTAGKGGLIESFNPAARGLFGYRDDEAIGHPLSLTMAPDRREEFQALAEAPNRQLTNAGGVDRPIETLGRRKDGSTFAMEVERGEIKRGDQTLTLAFVRDISERKAYTESLEHQALHDPLTGLANRTLFGEHLLQALASAKRDDADAAMYVAKRSGGGHAVFDAAQEAAAARQLERLTDLRQCVPREELVIHYQPKIDLGWGTAPDRLTLELTEGALIEAAAPDILGRLRRMGEKMSVDDFGTGYSSLAYLQRLRVDELKIDRSFVTSLALASDEEVIVRSTIELAHKLGLSVVAEGVEDENVLRLLADHDCDGAQGYFFSRPCVADELTAWLTASPYKVPVVAH
jgi:PAS domain S-box-containing protein